MEKQDNPKSAKSRKAKKPRKEAQAGYSAKNRDKVAASGAPQRDHVALSVLYVAMQRSKKKCLISNEIIEQAFQDLKADGYDPEATWARIKIMRQQPRRKLTPPKPKAR